MRTSRPSLIAFLLLAGLLASAPGAWDLVEAGSSDGDCSEPCPSDSSDGNCSSSCDECTCCPRATRVVLTPLVAPEAPQWIEPAPAANAQPEPLVFVRGVFHPPRG